MGLLDLHLFFSGLRSQVGGGVWLVCFFFCFFCSFRFACQTRGPVAPWPSSLF
jgi:hypothetical protein